MRFLLGYISVPAVTASNGFAFTASHFEERKVTKRSCPFRPVPRLGSAFSKRTRSPVGAELARDDGLTADRYLPDVPESNVGAGLPAMAT